MTDRQSRLAVGLNQRENATAPVSIYAGILEVCWNGGFTTACRCLSGNSDAALVIFMHRNCFSAAAAPQTCSIINPMIYALPAPTRFLTRLL